MDAIPTSIQTALELFETTLADVRFADIDGETLTRAAAEVRAMATVVASAQAALDSARFALQERQNALFEQVQRAMAYARVYAETDEALTERLNAIAWPRAGRGARAKEDAALVLSSAPQRTAQPRGRPRKGPLSEPMLVVNLPRGGMGADDGDKAASGGS